MLHSPSEASAKALPRVSIKSPELNASLTSLIQDMVNLNGKRSNGFDEETLRCSREAVRQRRGWPPDDLVPRFHDSNHITAVNGGTNSLRFPDEKVTYWQVHELIGFMESMY